MIILYKHVTLQEPGYKDFGFIFVHKNKGLTSIMKS